MSTQIQTLTTTDSEFEEFLSALSGSTTPVGVDTETTGLDVVSGRDYLQGFSVSFNVGDEEWDRYIPVRHETDNMARGDVLRVIEILYTKGLVFFNRKFDLHSFMTMNIDLSVVHAYDMLLMSHMINENRPYAKTLDNVGQFYLKRGKTAKDDVDRYTKLFGWGSIPVSVIRPYAIGDSRLTLDLYFELENRFIKEFGDKAGNLWVTEFNFQNVLFKMEQRGIRVNLDFCATMEGISKLEMIEIEDALGFKPSGSLELSKFLFKTLDLPVLERTPGGKPSMAKNVMEEYDRMLEQHSDDRAELVLNYRGWQKAVSTFYKPFQGLVDSNARIHCSYRQHGTTTGRLSCSSPNMQQIPRSSDKRWNGRIKNAFIPTEGYRLLSLDYSQLELRLAAAYGDETVLIEEFEKDDADPFTALANEIGIDRFTAKTLSYGLLYGAGKEKTSKILNRPLEEVGPIYDKFLKSIPGIIRIKRMCEAKAASQLYIRYWDGRKRHFTDRGEAYKAFNSLLQGGAASVVKNVMVTLDKEVCDENCHMLLQIHDEIVFEIKEEVYDDYKNRIIEIMEEIPTKLFGVRFKVGAK